MKIVHIEKYFNPLFSSQVNELMEHGGQDHEIILITSDDMSPFYMEYDKRIDEEYMEKHNVSIIRLKKVMSISNRIIMPGVMKTIRGLKPDVVFFHGVADFFDLSILFSKVDFLCVRDCHMSWVASRNKFREVYYKVMRYLVSPIINASPKYHKIYSLGVEEREYLEHIGITTSKIEDLLHGFDSSKYFFSSEHRKSIRESINISDERILVSYIGKIDNAKQPHKVVDIILKLKELKNVELLFVGNVHEQYSKIFYDKIDEGRRFGINIIHQDAVTSNDLFKYYSASDIGVWPKETTLSSIHAQACGLTVVMEAEKSNIDRVIESQYLFKIDDLDDAARKLSEIIESRIYLDRNRLIENEMLLSLEYNNRIQKLYESWENEIGSAKIV